jgi:surface protein
VSVKSIRGSQGTSASGTTSKRVVAPTKKPWVRNQYWPALADPAAEEFLALFAVFPNQDNFFAMQATAAYRYERGDGTEVFVGTGVTTYYNYDYTSAGLYSDANLPYKIAIIRITPQGAGQIATLNVAIKHNQAGLISGYNNGFLEVKGNLPNATAVTISTPGATVAKYIENVELLNLTKLGVTISNFLANSETSVRRIRLQFKNTANFQLQYAFASCRQLTDLQLEILGTGLPTICTSMFNGCTALINAPFFNTAAVTDMTNMFSNCYALTSVPHYNTAAATLCSGMFSNCSSLTGVPAFNFSAATTTATMFNSCYNLQSVPPFTFSSSLLTANNMFFNCRSIQTIPLLNFASVTNFSAMFSGCLALIEVPLLNTAAATDMSSMFFNCENLPTIPAFNTGAVTAMNLMFSGCASLVTMPTLNMANVANVTSMFANCTSLRELPTLNWNGVSSAANFTSFLNATKLTRIRATGARFTHTIASNVLTATALNEYYTNLGTGTGQTLTVTGNYGTAGDDPTIATAKGWTVTGS